MALRRALLAWPAATMLSATPAVAAETDFYAGKTIQLLIGFSAGGGYDIYARTLARHMGRHIPGNPRLIPQNMPGAGSLKAVITLLVVAVSAQMTLRGVFAAPRVNWLDVAGVTLSHPQDLGSMLSALLGIAAGTLRRIVLALLLAAVGIYGLVASGVTERRRELGIRMALGSSPLQTVRAAALPAVWLTVVGVAGNVRFSGIDDDAGLDVYAPNTQMFAGDSYLVVRTGMDPDALRGQIRAAIDRVDPDQSFFRRPDDDRARERLDLAPSRRDGGAGSVRRGRAVPRSDRHLRGDVHPAGLQRRKA